MLFNYKAIDNQGEARDGSIDASNVDIAVSTLQSKGLIISSIDTVREKGFFKNFSFFDRVSNKEVVIVSRQMATLFEAQVSALRIFKLLASQTENRTLQKSLSEVADSIQEGSSISQALEKQPHVFTPFYVNMVRSGEESGKLDQTFGYLSDYLDRSYEVTNKAKHALVYPAFVVVTFVGVMALMFTVIIPKITPILEESGQALPFYTRIVLGLSEFFVSYGLWFFVLLVIGGYFFKRFISSKAGKIVWDNFKISVPYVGNLYKNLYLSRIADNMNTMVLSGISMLKAVETTSLVVGNDIYKDILDKSLEMVKGGSSLSSAFSQFPQIPSIMTQMIKVGEETGELGNILKTLAKFYQREVVAAVDTLVDLIEPVMIVALGLGVGTLLASVLMPIYNLASSF
ncbi:MAG: type II secretion system F family protein [Candidatus Taylorbacteria bacterium]|nr:type II secretion system F family protein [Candidatus Taylorbacteria bacterium]